jgi:hypothetical protein
MLIHGCVLYSYDPADGTANRPIHESYSAVNAFIPELFIPPDWSIAGFSKNEIDHVAVASGEPSTELCFEVPLWFPLFLLLIAPVRWLIARPANVPAFPVITVAKQESRNGRIAAVCRDAIYDNSKSLVNNVTRMFYLEVWRDP